MRKILKVFIILAFLTAISGCRELSESLETGEDKNLKAVNREKPNLADESAKITVDPDSDKLTEEKNAPVVKQNSNTVTNTNTSTNVNSNSATNTNSSTNVNSDLATNEDTDTAQTNDVSETNSCDSEATLRSKESVAKSAFTLINQSKTPIVLYWVDYDGERIKYADLKPNAQTQQETYLKHTWVVTDSSGKCLRTFEAPGNIIIK